MPHLSSYLQPLCFGMQMWHLSSLPYINFFTPQYLHIFDIFAKSKFVQIRFFVQCLLSE